MPEKQLCPDCQLRGLAEELLFIPPREGRKQYLLCIQCEGEFPCDKDGKRIECPKSIERLCY